MTRADVGRRTHDLRDQECPWGEGGKSSSVGGDASVTPKPWSSGSRFQACQKRELITEESRDVDMTARIGFFHGKRESSSKIHTFLSYFSKNLLDKR
jgi:hypothetical protein